MAAQQLYNEYPVPERFPVAVKRWDREKIPDGTVMTYDFSEIQIAASGEADHFVGQSCCHIHANDVLVLHPGMENLYEGSSDFALTRILYDARAPLPALGKQDLPFLSVLYPDKSDSYNAAFPQTHIPDYNREMIFNLILRLSYETRREEPGKAAMISAMFSELMIYLARGNTTGLEKDRVWLLQTPMIWLNENYRKPFNADLLAKISGLSKRTLFRHFQRELGITPLHYLQEIRVRHASFLLKQTGKSISEIAESCGFCDSIYFARIFRAITGKSPYSFRKELHV